MPRLNKYGEAAMGVGDIVASVSGRTWAGSRNGIPAGGTQWYDDDTIIYQTYRQLPATWSNAYLEKCNIRTGKKTLVANKGANHIVAGGGRYLAFLNPEMYGALESNVAAPLAAGHDGTLAVVPIYQQDNGFILYAPDGTQTRGPEEPVTDIQVLGPDSAIWHTADLEIHTLNAGAPRQCFEHIWRPRLATVGSEVWIVYYAEQGNFKGLVAHPADSNEGYIVARGDKIYYHDIVELNGKLRIAWSSTQGEGPGDLVQVDLDVSQPRTAFNQNDPTTVAVAFRAASSGRTTIGLRETSALIKPQLGLLEDDIVYRLALLATNILQPLKNKYPNIVVKSGFREVNSGVGQHELGEAVDIQINNQTDALLMEVAQYIENNLPFDQLILNWSNAGDKQGWIHVSFTPNSLRGQVLTKDYADAFHEGLYFVQPIAGEEAASLLRDQSILDSEILTEMQKIQSRERRLEPISTVGDELVTVTNGADNEDELGGESAGSRHGSGRAGNNKQERIALVACVKGALNLRNADEATNINNAFEVVKRVAWLLRDERCGLLIGPPEGENIVSWNGYTFRAGRVCYPDGQIYKILTDVEGGAHQPGWVPDGMADPDKYVPAMDPGTNINQNWLQCPLPPLDDGDEPVEG